MGTSITCDGNLYLYVGNKMKLRVVRRLSSLLTILLLTSVLLISCGEGLQTFNKHGISFKVATELKLEEYTVNFEKQTFRRGTASYEQGAILSTEKNLTLLWLTTVPEFTQEEVRLSILSTPNAFGSLAGTFQAQVTGDLVTEQIADFKVTFADMQFSLPGWEAPGITAVWYCPTSQRTIQLILIHKQPKREMKRFIRSFACASHK